MTLRLLFLSMVCGSCTTSWLFRGSYDQRELVVQTLGLFNQRVGPSTEGVLWLDDWVFRRERLAAVDQELRTDRPDIFIMQEVLQKGGSPYESDLNILKAGALSGYGSSLARMKAYQDTLEEESLAVAVSLPLKIKPVGTPSAENQWVIGEGAFMSLTLVESEGEIISVFNIELPNNPQFISQWLSSILQKIELHFASSKYCKNRVLIAGRIPFVDKTQKTWLNFLERLELKEVVPDHCELSTKCFTRSKDNSIYRAIENQNELGRVDRILVSTMSLVSNSYRVFDREYPTSSYSRKYKIDAIFPSARFGWSNHVRFSRCRQ